MRSRGLYSKIGLRLGLLLLAAMVLIDLAIFMALQRALIQEKIAGARSFLSAWGDTGNRNVAAATRLAGAECMIHFDGGAPLIRGGDCATESLLADLQDQLRHSPEAIAYYGKSWGLLGPQPRYLALGVARGSQVRVGIWSLESGYQVLRRLQPVVAGYMIVNLILLELIGLFVFGRITAKPLQRLRRRAETVSDFNGEDLFFFGDSEPDDYAQLSRSLNRIYGRMKRDREALAQAVERLEGANRQLRQAQQEVLQAEKLAAVGRLSAGLAHEIGNPLGIVGGYLEILQQDSLDTTERRDIGRRAAAEVERIGRILRQLLDLARPVDQDGETTQVHELIRETVQIFAYQPLTSGIALASVLDASEDRVCGHADRLRQVFLNLMINAADAIRARGENFQGQLTIRTQNHSQQIRICFEDNGTGIEVKHLKEIFDPFFTTKEPGQGTGLGLAVSYMIVEALGGKMSVHSQIEIGTRMQIDLPLG